MMKVDEAILDTNKFLCGESSLTMNKTQTKMLTLYLVPNAFDEKIDEHNKL